MKTWMEDLSDELKASSTLESYDSAEAAFQGLIDTKAMMGNSLRIPSENASDDDMTAFVDKLMNRVPNVMLKPDMNDSEQSAAFYKTLGVPEEADKYTNPEGITVDPEAEAGLRTAALAMNMTQKQYQHAIKNMSETMTASETAAVDAKTEATNRLKGEWGTAYEQRMAMARKLHEMNFADTGVAFDDIDPVAIRGLYTTAKALMGSSNEFASHPVGDTPGITPEEAQMQIAEIWRNKATHPYFDQASPGNKAAIKKMLELQAAASGRTDEAFMQPMSNLRAGM